jgi:hypothetical protein
MPLPNRVDPFGELFATSARGLFMGNRGGRMHNDDQTLMKRRWASRQWICCVPEFKGRKRRVWSESSYTELFFLDEPTALAAGHRPCFECRRKDAEDFAEKWRQAQKLTTRPFADAMDDYLHAERLDGREKRVHQLPIDDLPDGAFVVMDGAPFAVRGDTLLHWTPDRYDARKPRPRGTVFHVLTPPATLAVLAAGYKPQWHPSAEA